MPQLLSFLYVICLRKAVTFYCRRNCLFHQPAYFPPPSLRDTSASGGYHRRMIFKLSIPLASIIFTATALPGIKGKDTVPLNASIFSSSISAFRFLESVTQPSLSLAIGKNTCEGNKLLPS